MSVVRTLALLAGGATIAGALFAAAPAGANPGMPNCGQLNFVCNLIPTMPDLDHDVDMTKGQPPAPAQDNQVPTDVCAIACI